MSEAPLNLQRALLWQGAVILLPIVILVVVGFYVLKQDQAAVTEEARQRAADVARDLSDRLGLQVATELSNFERVGNLWAGDGIAGSCWVHWPGRSPLTDEVLARYHNSLAEWQANYAELRPPEVFPVHASLIETGEIEAPKDYPSPPIPAPWLAELSAEQQALWREATRRHLNSSDADAVRAAFQEFLAADPPPAAKANAEFSLLLLDLNAATPAERVQRLLRFAGGHWNELSESGLPVTALALARVLPESASFGLREDLFDALNDQMFRGNASFLSAHLLAEEQRLAARQTPAVRRAVEEVRLRWESQERLRALARRVQETFRPTNVLTTNLWFDSAGQRWLAILNPGESGSMTSTNGHSITFTNRVTNLRFFPAPAVRRAAELAVHRTAQRMPEYFGTEVSVEDEKVVRAKAQTPRPLLLAEGAGRLSLPGVMLLSDNPVEEPRFGKEFETLPSQPRFSVAIYLVDPARLYAQARQRARVFGGLILAAASLAVLGVVRMFQALVRQQRLNEMKSNFVSSVSHELRAPIASVRLMAEGLESGRVKDEQKRHDYFKFIVQECRRLTSLVENVLDFSRIEKGRKEYEFEPIDMAALVEQTVKLMQTCADEKKVCLVIKWGSTGWPVQSSDSPTERSHKGSPEQNVNVSAEILHRPVNESPTGASESLALPNLNADGRALQQALVNLIDNAIKHSPVGSAVTVGLEVTASTRHETRSENSSSRPTHHVSRLPRLHLWVEDHGAGIPPHEHNRIFERFYRSGSELRRETQGVGIGLSIVKHIVEAHGGRVLVRSAIGAGSRFTIELPLQQLKAP